MNRQRLRCVKLLVGTVLVGMGALAVAADEPAPQSSPKTKVSKSGEQKSKAVVFSVDPTHSMALFRVRHGASMFWGRFNKVTGTVQYTEGSEDGLDLEVVVAIDSVDSGSEKLDGILKSEQFFFADNHATATFKSTSSRRTGKSTYEVTGEFTMRGVSKPLTVTVDWLGTSESRRGTTCGLETTFSVKRSDYGINYGLPGDFLGDDTKIILAIEGGLADGAGAERAEGGLPRFLARNDTNGDGKIQKSEAPERMKARFNSLDTNGDGAIDAAEAGAMRGGRRNNRSRGG